MDLNRVTLIGNVVRDPVVKVLPNGQLARFSVATNHVYRGGDNKELKNQTDYHSVTAWGNLATVVGSYVKKGEKVYLDGRLTTRSWDGQDGTKKYWTEVIANRLIFLGGKKPKADEALADEETVEELDGQDDLEEKEAAED
ncbi:MAG: single-stranded DNA-binding protein [bacterium]